MNQSDPLPLLYRPSFRVLTTWAWSILGPLLLALIILAVLQTDLSTARKAYAERPYLSSYFEIIVVGLLPVVFTVVCKDDLSLYGLGRKGLTKSLLLSALVLASVYGLS